MQKKVVLVVTSSAAQLLDPIIKRPGLIDNEINFGLPDQFQREEILKKQLKGINHQLDNLIEVSERTNGYVSSDFRALIAEVNSFFWNQNNLV